MVVYKMGKLVWHSVISKFIHFALVLILQNRKTFESLEKCRFVHRAISAGVAALGEQCWRFPERTSSTMP